MRQELDALVLRSFEETMDAIRTPASVVRSTRELRLGDRLYCMACMTRLVVVAGEGGRLEAEVVY